MRVSKVADQALQLHGGYGYLREYGLEKIVRDLQVHRILEGTNRNRARWSSAEARAARVRASAWEEPEHMSDTFKVAFLGLRPYGGPMSTNLVAGRATPCSGFDPAPARQPTPPPNSDVNGPDQLDLARWPGR